MTSPGGQAATDERPVLASAELTADEEIAGYYVRHRPGVRGFLIGACGCSEQDADDIIQDTIMVIRDRYWPTVRTYARPEAYWYKAAQRRYRRLRGQQARRAASTDPAQLPEVPCPADMLTAVGQHHAMMGILRRLPLRQRQVLWLRAAEDYSEADTALILGISEGSVKRHLHEAKKRAEELTVTDGETWGEEVR